MGWTKQQFIDQAYNEVGLADYVFDLQPEDLQKALVKMDSMMARWSGKGIKVNYPLPGGDQDASSLDDVTGCPDAANSAIYLNLALALVSGLGKVPSREMKQDAKTALKDLSTFVSFIPSRQYRSKTPAGAGNKPYRYTNDTFLPRPHIDCDAGASNR